MQLAENNARGLRKLAGDLARDILGVPNTDAELQFADEVADRLYDALVDAWRDLPDLHEWVDSGLYREAA